MNKYWFFFSYARNDANGYPYLMQFYEDLAREVRRMVPLAADTSTDDIGFFDQSEVETGEHWLETITEGTQSSRSLVCLYSRGYFNSDYCGREFEVFRSRINLLHESTRQAQIAPLIIPVLWDQPDRLPTPLPQPVSEVQHSHSELGEVYAKEGLLYVMRLRQHKDDYQKFLARFADRLVQQAQAANLPRLPALKSINEVESSFRVSSVPPQSHTLAETEGSGPSVAQFVFVAAKDNQFEGIREVVTCYGGTGGRNWKPYYPDDERTVGIMSQAAATLENLQYETLPTDEELIDKLRAAEQTNTIVVIVVDPWTIRLTSYAKPMLAFDSQRFLNCAVLVSWNENDEETIKERDNLSNVIRQIFSRLFIFKTVYFRDSIRSASDLDAALGDTLNEIRRRLLQTAKVLRPIEGSGSSIPEISGPGGTSA